MSTRIGPTLAIAAIATLLYAPALAEGETATPQEHALSQGELDALVAPIALYPLGPRTPGIVRRIESFSPDAGWQKADARP